MVVPSHHCRAVGALQNGYTYRGWVGKGRERLREHEKSRGRQYGYCGGLAANLAEHFKAGRAGGRGAGEAGEGVQGGGRRGKGAA